MIRTPGPDDGCKEQPSLIGCMPIRKHWPRCRRPPLEIFYSPTFAVGREFFWGNDRLEDALNWPRRPSSAPIDLQNSMHSTVLLSNPHPPGTSPNGRRTAAICTVRLLSSTAKPDHAASISVPPVRSISCHQVKPYRRPLGRRAVLDQHWGNT